MPMYILTFTQLSTPPDANVHINIHNCLYHQIPTYILTCIQLSGRYHYLSLYQEPTRPWQNFTCTVKQVSTEKSHGKSKQMRIQQVRTEIDGDTLSKDGVKPDDSKIKAVQEFQRPTFLGWIIIDIIW